MRARLQYILIWLQSLFEPDVLQQYIYKNNNKTAVRIFLNTSTHS